MSATKTKMAQAFKQIVCKKSFQKATITDIANESAMTRENFYYHFRDKYDIMRWIFQKEIVAALPPDEAPFTDWLSVLFSRTAQDYRYYRKLLRDLDADDVRQDLYPLFAHRIRVLVEENVDESVWNLRKEKIDFAVAFFTDAFLAYYVNYVLDHEEMDGEELQIGFAFLFDQFLSFVRNADEDSCVQER